ncbi:YcxB family protein [Streptomyces sp. NPDC048604]|uniref:YcxB family protein n=1 Tax=Streptomyces sp. NPDC048604 TaxID=3365578 RepID=UPI00371CFAE8
MTMELVYTPTCEDCADAVRVQMRHGSFKWLRRVLPVATVLAGLVVLLELFGPGEETDLGFVVLMAGLGLLTALLPWLTVRLSARQVYGLVGRQGEFRARVDEDGVRWTTRDSEVASRWQMIPRYAETATQFVLLSADKAGVGVAALPKRGFADPGDVDRLRELLDRTITRL